MIRCYKFNVSYHNSAWHHNPEANLNFNVLYLLKLTFLIEILFSLTKHSDTKECHDACKPEFMPLSHTFIIFLASHCSKARHETIHTKSIRYQYQTKIFCKVITLFPIFLKI